MERMKLIANVYSALCPTDDEKVIVFEIETYTEER